MFLNVWCLKCSSRRSWHTRGWETNKLDTNCKLRICDEECNLVFCLLCSRVVELSMTISTPPWNILGHMTLKCMKRWLPNLQEGPWCSEMSNVHCVQVGYNLAATVSTDLDSTDILLAKSSADDLNGTICFCADIPLLLIIIFSFYIGTKVHNCALPFMFVTMWQGFFYPFF